MYIIVLTNVTLTGKFIIIVFVVFFEYIIVIKS